MRKYEDKMFEKISVKKTAKKQKRDEWKRERKLQRKVKHARQEKFFAQQNNCPIVGHLT